MPRSTEGNGRLIAELAGATGVLLGLIFVGFEWRQNSVAVPEQTLVYEALFNRSLSLDRPINILAESVGPRGPEEIIAGMADYRFQSADFIHDIDSFGTADVNVIAGAEYSEIFTSEQPCGPRWAEFADRYSADRLYRLSGVGLSADSRQAVVYLEYEIDCFRAASFIRFEKDGSWRFVEEERVWVMSPPEV